MKLPFDNKVILHTHYLHPDKWKEAHSTNTISNLSFKIVSTLGNEAKKVFGSKYDSTVEDIVDKIRQEWKMHRVENIPSAYFQKDVNFSSSSSTKQKSQDYVHGEGPKCHDSTECSNFHWIDHYGHVLGIFLKVMAYQSTHTYSSFLQLFYLWVMPVLSLKGHFWLINIFFQCTEIMSMRRPL